MSSRPKPVALIILDGWGYSENTEFNAIANADTPVWDKLWQEHSHSFVRTSGADVGLPSEQMGNSEVGHMNLGAGRVVYQEFTRISRSIRTGSFFDNQTLIDAAKGAADNGKALHLMGLLSPGGVHSHEDHIHAMIKLAAQQGVKDVYVHAFLDGRDMPPKSAEPSFVALEECFRENGIGRLASVIGRYYAMDRDSRWDRISAGYELISQGKAAHQAVDGVTALHEAYERGETDEFVAATCIAADGQQPVSIEDGDAVVFMNFRSDRARQMTQAFTDDVFDGFDRGSRPALSSFTTLTEYKKEFDVAVAYPPERLVNGFGEYIAEQGLHQLRIAETEKYAHVTFFFNGGIEAPWEGEDRILIPSPQVATYDLQPEMSAPQVTDELIAAIESGKYDAIICNYANTDMVGHTGNYDAAIQAIQAVDSCLGRLYEALQKAGGEMLITADHGNAEQMCDPKSNQPHTAHTTNLVPLIYTGNQGELDDIGALCDIAPTMLTLMGLAVPEEMSGQALVKQVELEEA